MKIFANTVITLSAVTLLTIPSVIAQESKQSSEMPPTAPPLESLDSALSKLQSQGSSAGLLPAAEAAPAASAVEKQASPSVQSANGLANTTANQTQLAQASGLPFPMLYVYEFSAKWCPSCRKLEPITEATASKYSDFIQYSPVNVDANRELAQQYNVSQIPTIIVVDRQGRMLNRLIGIQQGEQLGEILQHYKQKALAAVGTTQ